MADKLNSVKSNTLTFKNMGEDVLTLDAENIGTYKTKVKNDYENIIATFENIATYINKVKSSCENSGPVHDELARLYNQIKTNKKSIITCANGRKTATLKRINNDVKDYEKAILGDKLKELEAKIALLEQKLSQMMEG